MLLFILFLFLLLWTDLFLKEASVAAAPVWFKVADAETELKTVQAWKK